MPTLFETSFPKSVTSRPTGLTKTAVASVALALELATRAYRSSRPLLHAAISLPAIATALGAVTAIRSVIVAHAVMCSWLLTAFQVTLLAMHVCGVALERYDVRLGRRVAAPRFVSRFRTLPLFFFAAAVTAVSRVFSSPAQVNPAGRWILKLEAEAWEEISFAQDKSWSYLFAESPVLVLSEDDDDDDDGESGNVARMDLADRFAERRDD